MGRRLVIFGRLPEAGRTKTRLAAAIGDGVATRLYQAFLDDTVSTLRDLAPTELWVPSRPGALASLTARYPGIDVRSQREGDLGERMAHAFASAFRDGVERCIIVGSDHPTLPARLVEAGFEALATRAVAIGPSRDGGYWGVGLKRTAWPAAEGLFEGAPWSTPALEGWTRDRASALGFDVARLPEWYDIDVPEDLDTLRADVSWGSSTGRALARLGAVGEEPEPERS